MMSNTNIFSKSNLKLFLFLIGIIFIFSIVNYIYIKNASINYIYADIWRFTEDNYIKLYQNGFSLDYLLNQKSHIAPWFQIFEYSSIHLYDFLQIYDIYIGFIFRILSLFTICFYLIKVLKLTNKTDIILFTVPITALYMNIVATQIYDWNQVSLRSVAEFFIIVLMISVDDLTRNTTFQSKFKIILFLCLLIFNIFIMTYDVVLISIIAIGFSLIISMKAFNYKIYFKIILAFLTVIFVHKIFFLLFVDSIELSVKSATISFQIESIIQYIHHMSIIVNSGFMNILLLKNKFIVFEEVITIVAPIVLTLMIISSFTYLYKKYSKYTLIPLMFIGYSLLFALALALFRWNPELNLLAVQPRNSIFLILGAIGLYIQLYLFFKANKKVLFILMFLVICLYFMHAWSAYNRIPYAKDYMDRNSLMLYVAAEEENDYVLPRSIVGKNAEYSNSLAFLKEYKLNVYSLSYKHPKSIAYYINNKNNYNRINGNINLNELDIKVKDKRTIINIDKKLILKIKVVSDKFYSLGLQTNIKEFQRINTAKGSQFFYFRKDSNKHILLVQKKGVTVEVIGAKELADD